MIRHPFFTVGLGITVLCASCSEQQPYLTGPISVSPDGSTILVVEMSSTGSQICSLASDGSNLTRITGDRASKDWATFSPDGRSIVYLTLNDSQSQICVMDRDGRNSRPLTSTDRSEIAPSYSPDGTKIVFARAARHRPGHWGGMTWDCWDIWQINSDGSSLRQLTHEHYYTIDPPHFSPDGKHVLFGAVTNLSGDHDLLIFDVGPEGSAINLRQVPLPVGGPKYYFDGSPSWSPDGSTIVFVSLRVTRPSPFDYEIWTASPNGSKLRQLTHNYSRCDAPVFSPDGKFIFYWMDGLWRMRADGSDATQLISWMPSPTDAGR